MRTVALCCPLVAFALVAGGCVSEPKHSAPVAKPAPRQAPSQPTVPAASAARYNLAGYSAPFKEGFADACAKRRDEERYKSDGDYQMGWTDGRSLCQRR